MENKSGISILFIMIGVFLLIVLVAGYFLFAGNMYNSTRTQTNNQQQNNQIDQTANWNAITNADAGVTFKYPADFGSKYASLQGAPLVLASSAISNIKA